MQTVCTFFQCCVQCPRQICHLDTYHIPGTPPPKLMQCWTRVWRLDRPWGSLPLLHSTTRTGTPRGMTHSPDSTSLSWNPNTTPRRHKQGMNATNRKKTRCEGETNTSHKGKPYILLKLTHHVPAGHGSAAWTPPRQTAPPGHMRHCAASESRYEPAGQTAMHSARSGDPNKPGSQGVHAAEEVMPAKGLNLPDGHNTPTARPVTGQYRPRGHGTLVIEPAMGHANPIGHGSSTDDRPAVGHIQPGGQSAAEPSPVPLQNDPTGHS
jgi:hypothetical protein